MGTISFTVPGVPVPKARPRAGRHGFYTPAKTKDYESTVAWSARAAGIKKPISGPVALALVFYMPIPASWSQKRQYAVVGNPHVSKPDCDNLMKAVMDGLNGIAWLDDSQVWMPSAAKIYAREGRVSVSISY